MNKLIRTFAISSLFFCSITYAQGRVDINEIEVKGVRLGMNKAEAEELLGTRINPKQFSIAGVSSKTPPAIFNNFIDEKLSSFTFLFHSSNFLQLLVAVKGKYPELICETSEVKNKMGAAFEQVQCKLNSPEGNLLLSKYYLDLNSSGLVLRSIQEIEQSRKVIEKNKKDI